MPVSTVVEESPVLLFTKEEYELHGRYTLLDHYTFNWPDGRMALALGLGLSSVGVPKVDCTNQFPHANS